MIRKDIEDWIGFLLRHKIRLIIWIACMALLEFVIIRDQPEISSLIFSEIMTIGLTYVLIFRDHSAKSIE